MLISIADVLPQMVSPHATLKVLQFPASFLGARAQPSSRGACQCVNLQRAVAGRVALSDEGAAKPHSCCDSVTNDLAGGMRRSLHEHPMKVGHITPNLS